MQQVIESNPVPPQTSNRYLATSIGRNTVFGVIANGMVIVTRLITVPVVIHHLGLDGYGIWSIIMVTAGYMRFGTAGIKSAFQKYVAEATATGGYKTANTLLSTGGIALLVLSVAGLIPIGVYSKELARLSGVPPHFLFAAAASITVLALSYAIANFGFAYEAIIMGGHRMDITRKANTVMTLSEAIAIIAVLQLGYGLLAMTLIMGISEVIYVLYCFRVSRKILPAVKISPRYFDTRAFPELIRFAGSYQMVNIFEVAYAAILPIALLKFFGPTAAGVAAVAGRLVGAALIAQEALILPILSGGTVVFTSQSFERMKLFVEKSFKMTLAAALPPLAIVCVFGSTIVMAWTGETGPEFRVAIWLTALAGLLRAIARLQLVLYRASGRALMDNIREVLRIVAIIGVVVFSKNIGFAGVLAGMALAELAGVIFMFFATSSPLRNLDLKVMIQDASRVFAATMMLIVAAAIPLILTAETHADSRWAAAVRLAIIGGTCVVVIWPVMVLTNTLSSSERQMIKDSIFARRLGASIPTK